MLEENKAQLGGNSFQKGGAPSPSPALTQIQEEGYSSIKKAKKGPFVVLAAILFLLIVIGGFLFYTIGRQKSELKNYAKRQVDNLQGLESTYSRVMELIRGTAEGQGAGRSRFLGTYVEIEEDPQGNQEESLEKVLGWEDNPDIVLARHLGELYREGRKITREIGELNQVIRESGQTPFAGFYLPKIDDLFDKTDKFVQETAALLAYLEEMNRLKIKATTLGFEVGMSIREAIIRRGDETSVNNLERKIAGLDEIKDEVVAVDTSALPKELRQDHLENLNELDEARWLFEEILVSLKNKDLALLDKSMRSLVLHSETLSQKGVIATVSFWQNNPTIRSVSALRSDWQEFANSF